MAKIYNGFDVLAGMDTVFAGGLHLKKSEIYFVQKKFKLIECERINRHQMLATATHQKNWWIDNNRTNDEQT